MIEYDPAKAEANLRKHGVSFWEAATCLDDPEALAMEDDAEGESRWVLIGKSAIGRLLVVVYTLRGDNPRLISARRATSREAKNYAQ